MSKWSNFKSYYDEDENQVVVYYTTDEFLALMEMMDRLEEDADNYPLEEEEEED